ncbi:unnamed protein product, partial [Prorocentrum cordatum]
TVRRDKAVHFAKLAGQVGRYDEMAAHMEAVGKSADELLAEDRNLLSAAYKSARGVALHGMSSPAWSKRRSARMARRIYSIRQGVFPNMEFEIGDISRKILAVMHSRLVEKATTGESKVLYQTMDNYRYIAEYTTCDDKTKDLTVTHSFRLGLALNFTVFQFEVLEKPDEAWKMAVTAFRGAIAELDNVAEDLYKDSTLAIQLFRDKLKLWTSDQGRALRRTQKRRADELKLAGKACPRRAERLRLAARAGLFRPALWISTAISAGNLGWRFWLGMSAGIAAAISAGDLGRGPRLRTSVGDL